MEYAAAVNMIKVPELNIYKTKRLTKNVVEFYFTSKVKLTSTTFDIARCFTKFVQTS